MSNSVPPAPDITPAQQQAALLLVLAAHLLAHPDLAPVDISTGGGQSTLHVHADMAAVAAWARSLGVTEMPSQGFPAPSSFVALRAAATLGGHELQLRGYPDDLDPDRFADNPTVSLDELTGGAS